MRVGAAVMMDTVPVLQESAPIIFPTLAVSVVIFLAIDFLVHVSVRKYRTRLWARSQKHINQLRRMTWQDFEVFAGDTFRMMGWKVKVTGGGGADDGADLLIWKDGRKGLVSCKKYKDKVRTTYVREAVGAAAFHRAKIVYEVGLSGFTPAAIQYAAGTKNVRLIDGQKLLKIRKGENVVQ